MEICFNPNATNNSPSVDPSGPVSADKKYIKLVDAAWSAYTEYQKNPSTVNVEALMQAVNALNTYFSGVSPSVMQTLQTTDPDAYAMYESLTQSAPHSASLATDCADYNTANCAETILFLQSDSGKALFKPFGDAIQPYGNINEDNGNATVKSDFDNLKFNLHLYNEAMQMPNPDPATISQLLGNIAADVQKLNTDATNGGITDGFLTSVLTLLNTTITPGVGGPTLLSLASGDPTTFQNALKAFGEGTDSSSGGDLMNLLNFDGKYEYGES